MPREARFFSKWATEARDFSRIALVFASLLLYSQSTIANIGKITLIEQVKGKDAVCKTPTQNLSYTYMTLCASPIHHTFTIPEGKKKYSFGKRKRKEKGGNERPKAGIILQVYLSASNQASL